MTTQYAAIPTIYNGVRFRSRLEAKWACTFDQLGWPWEYEPIDLNGWIPDFLVRHPKYDLPWLVEVKPIHNDRDPKIVEYQAKIDRCFGIVKKPHTDPLWEMFSGGDKFYYLYDWENTPPLEYMPVILVAHPMVRGVDVYQGELPPDDVLFMGWSFRFHSGWSWPCAHWADSAVLRRAWREACNRTQWKASR